jgi:uncharacterized protein YhhL (DUF1145 family)
MARGRLKRYLLPWVGIGKIVIGVYFTATILWRIAHPAPAPLPWSTIVVALFAVFFVLVWIVDGVCDCLPSDRDPA